MYQFPIAPIHYITVWDMLADEDYFDENDRANSQLVVKFPSTW